MSKNNTINCEETDNEKDTEEECGSDKVNYQCGNKSPAGAKIQLANFVLAICYRGTCCGCYSGWDVL